MADARQDLQVPAATPRREQLLEDLRDGGEQAALGSERRLGRLVWERRGSDERLIELLAEVPPVQRFVARIVFVRELGAERTARLFGRVPGASKVLVGTAERAVEPVPEPLGVRARYDFFRARALRDVLASPWFAESMHESDLRLELLASFEPHVTQAALCLYRGGGNRNVESPRRRMTTTPHLGHRSGSSSELPLGRVAERRAVTLFRQEAANQLQLGDPESTAVENALRRVGSGTELPVATRREMELRLGIDLRAVRIHDDEMAHRACVAINARAFTVGEDLFFSRGAFAADTIEGKRLLVHELTHVAQARAGRLPAGTASGVRVSDPAHPLEREAEQAAQDDAPVATGRRTRDSTASLDANAVAADRDGVAAKSPTEGTFLLRSPGLLSGAIDLVLTAQIYAIEHMPAWLLQGLGPLASLFKAGAIGYLKRLAKEGGDRLLDLLKNSTKALLSPSYIWGFIKGFLRGFFVDGLAGIFVLFWDIGNLAVKFAGWSAGIIKKLAGTDQSGIQALVDEIVDLGKWTNEHGPALWDEFKTYVSSGKIIGDVKDLLTLLVDKAKNVAEKIGSAIADNLIKFFSQSTDKLGEELGATVGDVAGIATFELVVAILTAGGSSVISVLKGTVKEVIELLGKGARAVLAVLGRVGRVIEDAYSAFKSWIATLGQTKFFKGLAERLEKLFAKLKELVQKLLGKFKKPEGEPHGAGGKKTGHTQGGHETPKSVKGANEVPKLPPSGPRRFAGDEAVRHFKDHGDQVMKALGKSSYNLAEYLKDANHVIQTGQWVPELNGYVKLIGGPGSAKAAFVGINRATSSITTFHIKSVQELIKKAPSLGWMR